MMTKIIINRYNKDKYNNGSYPEVISIECKLEELDENILKNFPNLSELYCCDAEIKDLSPLQYCKGLTKLYCTFNKITNLKGIQYCTELTELNCSYNEIIDLSPLQYCKKLTELNCNENKLIDISPLQYCTGLTKLYCNNNQIHNLRPLQYCTGLTKLNCSYNHIKVLNPLRFCHSLTRLYCSNNEITDLSPLRHCSSILIKLFCSNNQIKNLNPLQYCLRLTKLDCSSNQIADLSPIQHCTSLRELYCGLNIITSLESIIYLRTLERLNTYNNPLNPPSIQVSRFIERIEGNMRNNNSIYGDTQNVHDVKVQQSVMNSVRNLIKDELPNKITLDIDSILTSELKANTKSRLLEYFEDNDVHVILLITYKELFAYVWNRIINNPNKLELLKILDDNIQDSECKCFTGRFNRTLSTLVGFYDDIEINISDNSRISAIILQVKDSIIPYDPDKHKELSKIRLLEAGYDSETVNVWIEAIE